MKVFVLSFFKKVLIYLKLYPSIFFYSNPLKIYEFQELIKGFKISHNNVILNIGCSESIENFIIGLKAKKIYGIDIDEEAIRKLNEKAKQFKNLNYVFRCVNLEKAQFKSRFFDKIISICVLEHIPNYIEVLEESYKILKKGGNFFFSGDCLENVNNLKIIKIHKKIHKVAFLFRTNKLKEVLTKLGFKNIEIYPILKSSFAKKLFLNGMKINFQYRIYLAYIQYLFLKFHEKITKNKKGLFLIVKTEK